MSKLKLLICLLLFYNAAIAQEYVKITSVYDGDTFYTSDGRSIRLAGIDCPEVGQNGWLDAKKFASMFVLDKIVTIVCDGKDKYGRSICNVYSHFVWVNEFLVKFGYAWAYNKYSPEFHKLQVIAQQQHLGIWKYECIPPFIYRKQLKNL